MVSAPLRSAPLGSKEFQSSTWRQDTALALRTLFQKGRILAQDAVVGTSFTSTPRSTRRLLGLFSNYARRFPTTPLRDRAPEESEEFEDEDTQTVRILYGLVPQVEFFQDLHLM